MPVKRSELARQQFSAHLSVWPVLLGLFMLPVPAGQTCLSSLASRLGSFAPLSFEWVRGAPWFTCLSWTGAHVVNICNYIHKAHIYIHICTQPPSARRVVVHLCFFDGGACAQYMQ